MKAAVAELETLIVLKTMPVRRNKDAVDLVSLLRDNRNDINLNVLAQRAKAAALTEHLLE